MKFFKSLAIAVYTLIFFIIGGVLISLALDFLSSAEFINAVNFIYSDPNIKLTLGVVGAIFILGGVLTANISLGNMQREKTIAFENPEGQVTVSLSAIEDFIKKSVRQLPEVKEMRANVTASKKGISILCKATIFSDSNIPETTERVQNVVKSKVHDMLGVEETINTKIHITKISPRGKGETRLPPKEYKEASRRMPFGAGE